MNQKLLAEALYLFHRLEKLMREHGGEGTSFSDLIKSFNPSESEEVKQELSSCREFVESVDKSHYYYDRQSDTYKLKDHIEKAAIENNLYDEKSEEAKRYNRCKKMIRAFYEDQEDLMDGMYPTLKVIGHERNQLLHIYNYNIENFKRFKKACLQMIAYFERGTLPPENKRVYLKEPRKRQQTFTSEYSSSKEGFNLFWILMALLYSISVIGIYFYFKHTTFVESILYAIPVMILILAAIGFVIENLAGVIVIGALAGGFELYQLYHSPPSHVKEKTNTFPVSRDHYVHPRTPNIRSMPHRSAPKHVKEKTNTFPECRDYYVHTRTLNIRSMPHRSAPKSGILHRNEKVCVIGKEGAWYHLRNQGWVWGAYLSLKPSSVSPKTSRKPHDTKRHPSHTRKKHVAKTVYHCVAKGKRASGWAEKIGISQAKKEALHQCEMRREEAMPCQITSCYPIR